MTRLHWTYAQMSLDEVNPLHPDVKYRRQAKTFKLFQNNCEIQIFIAIFGFSMKNAFK